MKNIPKTALLALPIQFPTFEEQSVIAAVLFDMDAEIAALEARRDKTRAIKQGDMIRRCAEAGLAEPEFKLNRRVRDGRASSGWREGHPGSRPGSRPGSQAGSGSDGIDDAPGAPGGARPARQRALSHGLPHPGARRRPDRDDDSRQAHEPPARSPHVDPSCYRVERGVDFCEQSSFSAVSSALGAAATGVAWLDARGFTELRDYICAA